MELGLREETRGETSSRIAVPATFPPWARLHRWRRNAWDPDGPKSKPWQPRWRERCLNWKCAAGIDLGGCHREGHDKAYGMRALLQATALAPHQVLFVGTGSRSL